MHYIVVHVAQTRNTQSQPASTLRVAQARPVCPGLGHPSLIGVVFDQVEHHHVELAALEPVRHADLGRVPPVGLVVTEGFQGGLGLMSVRGDHADVLPTTMVVVGEHPGQQCADELYADKGLHVESVTQTQLAAFGTLLPEDQFEVLELLAEGFTPDQVYRDVVARRRPADADPRGTNSLELAITNTRDRSTEEILTWSTRLLHGTHVADLGGDGDDRLTGYRSLLRGRRPHAAGHETEEAEIATLVECVREWLDQGVRAGEIAVCTRFRAMLDRVHDGLTTAGIPAVVGQGPTGRRRRRGTPGHDARHEGPGVRCVAVLGVSATAVPYAKELTPAEVDRLQHDSDLLRERYVLFVSWTGAREALHVSWTGAPSPFLPIGSPDGRSQSAAIR